MSQLDTTASTLATLTDQVGAAETVEALATTPTTCAVYPGLCTVDDGKDRINTDENGRHFDHAGRTISVPGLEIADDPEIWAEFIHLSASTPKIGFMGADLTPAQVREKAQQLRKFADQLDELAEQVEAFQQAEVRS